MTYLVYLDEQEGEIDGEAYTAVIGFRVHARDIIKVRTSFYPMYNEILDQAIRGSDRSKGKHIHQMPDLHGSNLLREYSDEVKFQVLDALMKSLMDIDCDFLRIGYFNRSFRDEMSMDSRAKKIDFATLSVGFAIQDKPDEYHILVSEFDKESLKRSLDKTFSNLSTVFAFGEKSASINISRLIGHYHATKSELGCQIADVINYCCLKWSNPKGEFSSRLSKYYEVFAEKYLVNQIIWINDKEQTHHFTQKNPVSKEGTDPNMTPISRIFTVIPNDETFQTEEIPPVNR